MMIPFQTTPLPATGITSGIAGALWRMPRASRRSVALLLVLLGAARAEASVTITFASPVSGQHQGAERISISVSVSSSRQLTAVTASIGSLSWPMTATGPGSFAVEVDPTPLASGAQTVTVDAVDVDGLHGTGSQSFVVDRLPTVAVESPVVSTVVRNSLRVAASCADDLGPCTVTVAVRPARHGDGPPNTPITGWTTSSSTDRTICLGESDSHELDVEVFATDNAGQTSQHLNDLPAYVVVNASPMVTPVVRVPGQLVAASEDRLIFFDATANAYAVGLDGGNPVGLGTVHPLSFNTGYGQMIYYDVAGAFFDGGVALVTGASQTYGSTTYAIRAVTADTRVDTEAVTAQVSFAGPRAVYRDVAGVSTLDLTTGALTTLQGAGVVSATTSSGDVYASAQTSDGAFVLNRYPIGAGGEEVFDGGTTQLRQVAVDTGAVAVVDGANTLWRETPPGSPPVNLGHYPALDKLRVSGAWTGFVLPTGISSHSQVFTIDSSGAASQRTFEGSPVSLEALNPVGEFTFIENGQRLLAWADGGISNLGPSFGSVSYAGGRWFVVQGDALLEAAPAPSLAACVATSNDPVADAGDPTPDGGTDSQPPAPGHRGCDASGAATASLALLLVLATLRPGLRPRGR